MLLYQYSYAYTLSHYLLLCCFFFFFNDTATTEIYTLSLHDALPICEGTSDSVGGACTSTWTLFALPASSAPFWTAAQNGLPPPGPFMSTRILTLAAALAGAEAAGDAPPPQAA